MEVIGFQDYNQGITSITGVEKHELSIAEKGSTLTAQPVPVIELFGGGWRNLQE
jgi:hypothetical protein